MSQSNPFSRANAQQHNLVSKLVTGIDSAYEVAVDLVDIDTAYVKEIGSTANPVQLAYIRQIGSSGGSGSSGSAYFNDLYVTRINGSSYPPPGGTGSGGPGPTGPTGPTGGGPYFIGGTGINVTYTGQTGSITNTGVVGITPGFGISVTPIIGAYNQYQVSYTGGTTGGGPPGPTGPAGPNVQGPTGQLVYFGNGGFTSSSQLTYDGTKASAPALQLVTGNTQLYLEAVGNTSTIYSGRINGSNILNISNSRGFPAMTLNTASQSLGISNSNPTFSLDVNGNTRIVYGGTTGATGVSGGSGISGSCALAAGSTYTIYGWGGGGAGNGGTGGAGGFSEVQFTTGPVGSTLRWSQLYGGTGGGGNALVAWLEGGPTFMYVPGGGAGATGGGVGSAAGEIPSGLTATYIDRNFWTYTTTSSTALSTPTFQYANIYSSIARGNATISINQQVPYNDSVSTSPSGVTYTFTVPAGTTYTVTSYGITFAGTTMQTPQDKLGVLVNQTFTNVGGGTGNTYAVGDYLLSGGTAAYSSVIGNPTMQDGLFLGTSGMTSSVGDVYWNGSYTARLLQGFTFAVLGPPSGTIGFIGNTLSAPVGATFIFPTFNSYLSGALRTTGSAIGASGSKINVNSRLFRETAQLATGPTGVVLGGGGYTGGSNPAYITNIPVTGAVSPSLGNAPAGGGGGSWFLNTTSLTALGFSNISKVDYGGIGIYSYGNIYGSYGTGSTSLSINPGFLIINKINTLTSPNPALTVIGNETVNGSVSTGTLPQGYIQTKIQNGDVVAAGGVMAGNCLAVSMLSTAAVGGGVQGISTQSGGKVMWNSVLPGAGRTELINAWGGATGTGFGFYAGPDGSTAQQPTGTLRNLGFWDTSGLVVQGGITANNLVVIQGITANTLVVNQGITANNLIVNQGITASRVAAGTFVFTVTNL